MGHVDIDVSERPQRVEAAQGAADAVHAGLFRQLFLKGAKQPVPEDEQAAIVAVEVAVVLGVMHPVVGRRNEDPFVPAELWYMLGMHPELVDQVQGAHGDHHFRRNAQQKHGNKENPAEQEPGAGLAQGGAEVVVLALMVRHVRGPENGALVAQPVQPVIAEVVEHHGQHPGPPVAGVQQRQGKVLGDQIINIAASAQSDEALRLAQGAQEQTADAVVEAVGIAPLAPAIEQLQQHGQDKEGYRVNDQVHALDACCCGILPTKVEPSGKSNADGGIVAAGGPLAKLGGGA